MSADGNRQSNYNDIRQSTMGSTNNSPSSTTSKPAVNSSHTDSNTVFLEHEYRKIIKRAFTR